MFPKGLDIYRVPGHNRGMNTATVTSKSNGSVYMVLDWPADFEPEDIRPGTLWVKDADGTQFSVREGKVTGGGEYTVTSPKAEASRDWHAEMDAVVAANEARERKENRRSYYLRTGR